MCSQAARAVQAVARDTNEKGDEWMKSNYFNPEFERFWVFTKRKKNLCVFVGLQSPKHKEKKAFFHIENSLLTCVLTKI